LVIRDHVAPNNTISTHKSLTKSDTYTSDVISSTKYVYHTKIHTIPTANNVAFCIRIEIGYTPYTTVKKPTNTNKNIYITVLYSRISEATIAVPCANKKPKYIKNAPQTIETIDLFKISNMLCC